MVFIKPLIFSNTLPEENQMFHCIKHDTRKILIYMTESFIFKSYYRTNTERNIFVFLQKRDWKFKYFAMQMFYSAERNDFLI